MARLVWDQESERLYETGISNVVLYTWNGTAQETAKGNKWNTGVAWNGVTAVTESPSGAEASDLYADNIKYLSLRSVEQLGATIEAYMYPPEFGECDGTAVFGIDNLKEDYNGASEGPFKDWKGAGIIIGQQSRKPFCLAYKTVIGNDTLYDDYGYKLHLLYNATASPSERAYNTINDSPEANAFSWELTTNPISVTGYKPTSLITIDSTKVPPKALAAIEDALFGSSSVEPKILLPDELKTLLTNGAVD